MFAEDLVIFFLELKNKKNMSADWWGLNPQPSDLESDTLTITPQSPDPITSLSFL